MGEKPPASQEAASEDAITEQLLNTAREHARRLDTISGAGHPVFEVERIKTQIQVSLAELLCTALAFNTKSVKRAIDAHTEFMGSLASMLNQLTRWLVIATWVGGLAGVVLAGATAFQVWHEFHHPRDVPPPIINVAPAPAPGVDVQPVITVPPSPPAATAPRAKKAHQ